MTRRIPRQRARYYTVIVTGPGRRTRRFEHHTADTANTVVAAMIRCHSAGIKAGTVQVKVIDGAPCPNTDCGLHPEPLDRSTPHCPTRCCGTTA